MWDVLPPFSHTYYSALTRYVDVSPIIGFYYIKLTGDALPISHTYYSKLNR